MSSTTTLAIQSGILMIHRVHSEIGSLYLVPHRLYNISTTGIGVGNIANFAIDYHNTNLEGCYCLTCRFAALTTPQTMHLIFHLLQITNCAVPLTCTGDIYDLDQNQYRLCEKWCVPTLCIIMLYLLVSRPVVYRVVETAATVVLLSASNVEFCPWLRLACTVSSLVCSRLSWISPKGTGYFIDSFTEIRPFSST